MNGASHSELIHAPFADGSLEAPGEGSLPPEVAQALHQILAAHTTRPDLCWFAVWDGWGCLDATMRSSPAFILPNRRYHLFYSSITAIEVSFCHSPSNQSANLWWSDDCAWCVATEIDFMSTYVAGTTAAIDAISACTMLEVDRVEPTDGVAWASDTINPRAV